MQAKTFKKIWAIPFWLSAFTLFGLLAALLGTGVWYWLAWVTITIPIAVIAHKLLKRQR